MYLASDNIGPVPNQIFDALKEANVGTCASYGADPLTAEVIEKIRNIFEAPKAAVYIVATCTADNAIVVLNCAPTEMTWKRGIDALPFGCSKNGLMSGKVVIFFNPSHV